MTTTGASSLYVRGGSYLGKRVGFVRCNPDGSNLEPLDLLAGEDIPELGLNAGDQVTTFYRFDVVYPWQLTLIGKDLIVTHKDGIAYQWCGGNGSLGTLGGLQSSAMAINNNNQKVLADSHGEDQEGGYSPWKPAAGYEKR